MQSGLLEQHVEIRWNSADSMVSDIEIMKSISKSILRSMLNMIKHDSCSKILGFTVLRPYNYGRSSWNGQWWRVLSYGHRVSLGCNLLLKNPFDQIVVSFCLQMFRVLGLPDDVGSMFVHVCPIFFTVEVVFPGWCHSSARLLLLRQAPGWAIYTESFADGFRWIVCMEGHDHQYWVILDFIDMFTSFLYVYNPLQHRSKMLQSNI